MAKSSKLTAGRKSYEPVFSLDSPFAGLLICGCLVKLKRGFEGTGRVAVVSLAGVGRKERVSREATLAPLAILLCLLKSWGRSRGPNGTLALPRPAALLLMVGSGRAALIALDALVLRRRLPWSPVFWNLRTRSSEEPLESSDMLDPDRSGTLVDSMVRVVVRGCVDMVRRCQLHSWSSRHRQLELCCHEMLQRKKKVFLFQRTPRGSPSVELGHRGRPMPTCRTDPATAVKAIGGR